MTFKQIHHKQSGIQKFRKLPQQSIKSPPPQIADTLQKSQPFSADQIMMLQRTIGNQAVINLLHNQNKAPPIQRRFPWRGKSGTEKRKAMKNVGRVNPNPTVEEDNDNETLNDVADSVGFTSDTFGEVGDTLGNFGDSVKSAKFESIKSDWLSKNGLPPDTNIDDLSDEQQENFNQEQEDKGGLRQFGSEGDRENLAIASSAAGTVSSGFSSVMGFVAMVNSIKNATDTNKDGYERTEAVMDAVGQGSQTIFSGAQVLTGTSQTIAGGVAKGGGDAASTAADVSGGVGDMFGSLGGAVELGVSTAKGILGLVKYFTSIKSKGWGQRDQIVDIVENFMDAIKGFLSTSKTVMSVVNTFLDIAGKGADFVNAFPVVGAAINIAIQLIDTIVQAVHVASQTYQMAKSIIRQIKMNTKLKAEELLTTPNNEKIRFLGKLVEVNKKRWRRAIIPLTSALTKILANVVSVGASVLNIVGAATSAAYGAGIGIMAGGYGLSATAGIMKLGAASMKPIATFTRWSKQKIRDEGGSKIAKIGNKVGIDMTKTTNFKKTEYQENAKNFLTMLKALPTWRDGDIDVKKQYEEHYQMLKATGINTKELFNETDGAKQEQLIIEALQKRE